MNQDLFKKYQSISNTYRKGYIRRWLDKMPELAFEDFIITEKIHGANLQILITPDVTKFGKRTELLIDGVNFFGHMEVMAKYQDMIDALRVHLKSHSYETIRVYGEIFGGNIQKGIEYGKEKRFRVFDIEIDDIPLTPEQLIDLLTDIGCIQYYAPILGIVKGIETALSFNTNFNTTLYDKEDNMCEGVVIKPYNKLYGFDDVSQFTLKLKNQAFAEIDDDAEIEIVYSDTFKQVQHIFKKHLTFNRLQGIFSKHGPIENHSEMNEYVKYMSKDARIDFLEDYMNDFLEVPDKERSKIFGVVREVVAPLLIEYLEKEAD